MTTKQIFAGLLPSKPNGVRRKPIYAQRRVIMNVDNPRETNAIPFTLGVEQTGYVFDVQMDISHSSPLAQVDPGGYMQLMLVEY